MSQESTQSISMILTAVLGLARTVRQAQEDGKIQWYEAASLALAPARRLCLLYGIRPLVDSTTLSAS